MAKPKVLALALVWRGNQLLVQSGTDMVTGRPFYRPPGGRVEFGERGAEAVVRELQEEIGADLVDVTFAGVHENLFTYQGKPGHEVILFYEGRLADSALLAQEEITGAEGERPMRFVWRSFEEARAEGVQIFPLELEAATRQRAGAAGPAAP